MRLNLPFRAPTLTFLLALFVYILTLAPDLTWANWGTDGGELITAAVTLGVPHPPGYPTYVLLGKLFSFLPMGTMAYRFNLFSAVCVALAAALVTATANAQHSTDNRWGSIAAGLCLALAPLVWGQAVITEVYGLNLALVAALLWALLGKRPSLLVGLLFGLCLTTHLTSILLLPLVLVLTPRFQWSKVILGAAIGLLPLLVLPLLARSGSPVVWGQPDTWRGWWWLITGALYRYNLFTADWPSRLWPWSKILFSQFTWLGLLFIVIGLLVPQPSRAKFFLLATALLYFVYALTYNTHDATVLLLPAILLLSLIMADGISFVNYWGLLLPLALLLLNFSQQNLREEQAIRPLAVAQLQTAPRDAILLMSGEGSLFTMWYLQYVEGYRPDLILIDKNLFAFDWYRWQLQQRYPQVAWPTNYDLAALTHQTERPLCTIDPWPTLICPSPAFDT